MLLNYEVVKPSFLLQLNAVDSNLGKQKLISLTRFKVHNAQF